MQQADLSSKEPFFSCFGFPRTQLLIEKVPFVIVVLDAERRIRYLNETGEKTYQCPLATAQGRPLESILFVTEPMVVSNALATAYQGKVVFNLTWSEEQYHAGRIFWRQATFIPFHDESNAVNHVVVTINDITEQIREQKRLLKSQEHYRMIFECAPEGILILERYYLRGVNPAWERLTGYGEKDLAGVHVEHLCPPCQENGDASRQRLEALIDQALSGKGQSFQWRWKKKDGTIFNSYVGISHLSGFRNPDLASLVQAMVREA